MRILQIELHKERCSYSRWEKIIAATKKTVVKKAVAKRPVITPERIGVDWKSLYLYAVCLITLMVVLFSVISFVNGVLGVALPEPAYIDPYATDTVKPDKAALAAQETNEQRRAVRGLLNSLVTFAVAAPLYLYHWRQTRTI